MGGNIESNAETDELLISWVVEKRLQLVEFVIAKQYVDSTFAGLSGIGELAFSLKVGVGSVVIACLLYTSPSPRDRG